MSKENLESVELKVMKLEDEEDAFSLVLPAKETYTMTLSGWIYSRYLEKKYEDATVWVSINGGFKLIEQFSLCQLGAYPHFVARGKDAFDALTTIKEAFLSFNPDDFDSDGYYIK